MSEGEYISDWDIDFDDDIDNFWDDNIIVNEHPYRNSSRFNRLKNRKGRDKAGRKKALSKDIENIKAENKLKKKGDTCICPMCKQEFIKSSYQQVFDCPECHDKYHTLRYR